MRVIAGSARRLLLKTPEGMETRPTQDRVKETLFNILQDELMGCRFLDLFAGSGGIGIEALSRGASYAAFVDNQKAPLECIKYNLEHTHLSGKATVIGRDVFAAIATLSSGTPFDIVFMDPPYRLGVEGRVLDALNNCPLVNDDTLVIIEAALDTDFSFAAEHGYELLRIKEYKTNKHVFMKRTH